MTTWMMTLLLNDEIGNFLYVTYENTDADFSTWNRKTVFHFWKSQFIPLAQSCPILCNPMDCSTPGFPIHHQLPELAHTHVQSRWCHPTISSSIIPFSSCPQPFPASGSFPMSQFFASGGQSIGASASVLPINIRGCFPLGWTAWISFLSKGLSRVFSNTIVQKHQFFGTQHSLWSNSHICTLVQCL